MENVLNRHATAALMFSGGKDSLACLYLLRPYWHKIAVIWVNSGNTFPENESLVRNHAAQVPHFIEVKSDVASFKATHGLPSDLVPIQHTSLGQCATGKKEIKLISGYECCAQNLWYPAMKSARQIGATLIIRGQRNEEYAKSPVRSGDIREGMEFFFPIEEWTQNEVIEYLASQGVEIPEWFSFTESSLDCINCTAFLSGIEDRIDYMKKYHPADHQANNETLAKIAGAVESELAVMKRYMSK